MVNASITKTARFAPGPDVAIRMRAPRQADVIGRKLWSMRMGLYASRSYLDQRGTPETVKDLADHDLIIYNETAPQPSYEIDWLFREGNSGVTLRPRVTVSTQLAVLEAVRNGVGIGIVPEYLTNDDESLLRVLPDCIGPEIEPHLVYATEMKSSKRVAVFRAFLLAEALQPVSHSISVGRIRTRAVLFFRLARALQSTSHH